MKTPLIGLLAAATLAVSGCASGGGEGPGAGVNFFNLAGGYDTQLDGLVDNAMAADSDGELTSQVEAIAALGAEASEKADAAADDSDARLVWLSIAANAYDKAALLTPTGADAVKGYRSNVLSVTSTLDELCQEGVTDTRLGYRCAAGSMMPVLNGSETALAEFEAAVSSSDLEAATTSAEAYGTAVTQDWPGYQDMIAVYPLGDQDLTPIAERQIANACAFNQAANSGTPTWQNSVRTMAQSGNAEAVSARNAYFEAAADVAQTLAVEPAGDACSAEGERSRQCVGQLERGLTFFCNAQSAS